MKNEDDLKKNEKNEDDLKKIKTTLKNKKTKKQKKIIGCDIIVN